MGVGPGRSPAQPAKGHSPTSIRAAGSAVRGVSTIYRERLTSDECGLVGQ